MAPRMTTAQREQFGESPIAVPRSLPAPITGWNTRDALDAMAPTDAVTLDNFYPDAGGVNLRNGYAPYASGMGTLGYVKTLAEYSAGSIDKFIAGANLSFYDISNPGPVGAPLASGFSSDQWQSVYFLSKLFFMNGVDTMQVFNGSGFSNANFTGATLSSIIGGIQYQNRLFFWQSNSTGFYFAPLNSINGSLSFYDLSAFSPRGGNLIAAATYSHDGGNGVLDFIAFMMSSGDCLVYYGNDPSNANAWSLVGIYRISPPVSPRAVCNYGAEAFLTTADDHVPLQQQLVALRLGQLPPRSKASTAVQAAFNANAAAFGWQALYYPGGRRLIFNIPNVDGSYDQHVCNTGVQVGGSQSIVQSDAHPWCRFRFMPAATWGLYKNKLYFGGPAGAVYQADTGNLDNLGAVMGTAQQAWNTFGDPATKRVSAVRPIISSVGSIKYNFGLGFDYGDLNVPLAISTVNQGSPWDTSPWDVSPWSPETQIDTSWHSGTGEGQAIGMRLQVSGTQPISWLRTDFRTEPGSAL